MDKDNLLRLAVQTFGQDAQSRMASEEWRDLTKELCKFYRSDYRTVESVTNNIVEEIADCKIMLRQLELLFGDSSYFEKVKLERLEKLINNR